MKAAPLWEALEQAEEGGCHKRSCIDGGITAAGVLAAVDIYVVLTIGVSARAAAALEAMQHTIVQ